MHKNQYNINFFGVYLFMEDNVFTKLRLAHGHVFVGDVKSLSVGRRAIFIKIFEIFQNGCNQYKNKIISVESVQTIGDPIIPPMGAPGWLDP